MKFKYLIIATCIILAAPACSSKKSDEATPVAASPETASIQDQASNTAEAPAKKKKTKKIKVKKEVSDSDYSK
jgi:ABC-type enterochelin transport system substrate-binding protein